MRRDVLDKTRLFGKNFFVVFTLFNVLSWLYITTVLLTDIIGVQRTSYAQNIIVWAIYFSALVGSSFVGSVLSKKIQRSKLICSWMFFGGLVTLSAILLQNFTKNNVWLFSLLLGISSGFGMPSCLAYFADNTSVENRGRISGMVFLITNLMAPFLIILFGMLNLMMGLFVLSIWKFFGIITFFIKREERVDVKKDDFSFVSILRSRPFIFYFIGWFMFCLIDRFEKPILANFAELSIIGSLMGPIIGGLSAFVGGLLCDRVGRKRIVLFGFVSMGVSYAIIGLVPNSIFMLYLFIAIESAAAGFLWVTFILILWGDLSPPGTREKYYVIGATPFYATDILRVISASYIEYVPPVSAFSLASFFLFIAVFPLLYASETLPERKIVLDRLKKYVERAKKIEEKFVVTED